MQGDPVCKLRPLDFDDLGLACQLPGLALQHCQHVGLAGFVLLSNDAHSFGAVLQRCSFVTSQAVTKKIAPR